jgi:hypothetical protein
MPMAWKMGLSSGMVIGIEEARRSVPDEKKRNARAGRAIKRIRGARLR